MPRMSPTPYAWIITGTPTTDDFQCEPDSFRPTGPHDAPDELLAKLAAGEGDKFRLRDDDNIVYFEGRIIVADPDEHGGEIMFAPLEDLGRAYGAVDIQYRERTDAGGTKWASL